MVLHQIPPSVDERERIRELSRYYCTIGRHLPSHTFNGFSTDDHRPTSTDSNDDEQSGVAYLSSDITLTALAQLGVHRFQCNRSFVSIIDGENQHIIAEATASISLQDENQHLPNDGIYLGVRTLDLVWGVCPHTMLLFTGRDSSRNIETDNITANQTCYIIRDFTKEDNFKDRPYVVQWPHMRFYAEVPLYSPAGYVLGSYCVVDDKARMEFDHKDVAALREVADAIAQHIENVRIVNCHRRAENLVKGLTTFVKHHSDFDPTEVSAPTGCSSPTVSSADANSSENPIDGLGLTKVASVMPSSGKSTGDTRGTERSSLTDYTDQTSPLFPDSEPTDTTSLYSSNVDKTPIIQAGEIELEEVSIREKSNAAALSQRRFPMVSVTNESVAISERVARIFSRASVLLRDSMDLDGVLFLDACRSNSGVVSTAESGNWEPLPKTANPEYLVDQIPSPLDLPGIGSLSNESERLCEPLGYAFSPQSDTPSDLDSEPNITGDLLDAMIAAFPAGQILNLDVAGHDDSLLQKIQPQEEDQRVDKSSLARTANTTRQISIRLAKHLPGAKSVLFFPLWDWNKSRWLAGTLVWTRSSDRALGMEELHYFKAFGDSIISEVSRIVWAFTEKSKSDFISSLSHELRSPLHGILASAELLQASPLEPTQRDMTKMIETCGLTLLDTMNHLLDYSKINNLTTLKASNLDSQVDSDLTNLTTVFSLDVLVEEVADILYTGRRAPEPISHLASRGQSTNPQPDLSDQQSSRSEMAVVIRIEELHGWRVQSVAGAWRRIVMNLLGNAMKWTKSGFVEICLSKARKQVNSQSVLAHLSVTDTGRGIAPDFLRHRLFSPFAQEDSLSEGVGLGLSIVRQLVKSLGGNINVQSELGIGTQVDVYVPVRLLEPAASGFGDASIVLRPSIAATSVQLCLINFHGYPALREAPTGILSPDAKRKLAIQSSLAKVFMALPDWHVSLAESLEKAHGDVAVMEETTFMEALVDGQIPSELMAQTGLRFIIVLSGRTPLFTLENTFPNVIYIAQPLGPRKIEETMRIISERLHAGAQDKPAVSAPGGALPVRPHTPEAKLVRSSASKNPQVTISEVAGNMTSEDAPWEPLVPTTHKGPRDVHVLIADDNEINVKILVTFMRKVGCDCDTASNGLIALEKYKESDRRYDLVLMDLSMPVMDGLVATRKIRDYEKDQGLIPSRIMAVTGVASAAMQQQALAAGIDEYLVKPVSLHDLKKVMNLA